MRRSTINATLVAKLMLFGVMLPATESTARSYACDRLKRTKVSHIKPLIMGGDRDKIVFEFFEKELRDVTDAELLGLGNAYLDCAKFDPTFQTDMNQARYLDDKNGPVARMVNDVATIREEKIDEFKVVNGVTKFKAEIAEIGKNAGTMLLTDDELSRIAAVEELARQEMRKLRDQRFLDVANAGRAVRERDRGLRERTAQKAEAQTQAKNDAEQHANKPVEIALGYIQIYVIADFCAERGSVFTRSEVEKFQANVRQMLDLHNVTDEKRETAFRSAQSAMSAVGFRSLPRRQLDGECQSVRNTMAFAMPDIFADAGTKRNPF